MLFITLSTKLLHYLPGEISHYIALKSLKLLHLCGLSKFFFNNSYQAAFDGERDIRNLFDEVGIAAGLDKNGDYIDCLAALGVSFIELGTVTPRPQEGNPKPRIFRNHKERSLLNRLGFNNKGVDYLVERLKERKSNVLVGSSIGKNHDTPNATASEDYIFCLKKVYEFSDYVAINISSPNTKNLRELGNTEYFQSLLEKLKNEQDTLSTTYGDKPIFIKISPDESPGNLELICKSILSTKLDGIICSNTTIDHDDINGPGGISGAPLKRKSNKTLQIVKTLLGDKIPIIASGGVMSAEDYEEKIESGATLVQIYTGFIFEGPKLIQDILALKTKQ